MKSVYCAVRTGSLNKAVCASYLRVNTRSECGTVQGQQAGLGISCSCGEAKGVVAEKQVYLSCKTYKWPIGTRTDARQTVVMMTESADGQWIVLFNAVCTVRHISMCR